MLTSMKNVRPFSALQFASIMIAGLLIGIVISASGCAGADCADGTCGGESDAGTKPDDAGTGGDTDATTGDDAATSDTGGQLYDCTNLVAELQKTWYSLPGECNIAGERTMKITVTAAVGTCKIKVTGNCSGLGPTTAPAEGTQMPIDSQGPLVRIRLRLETGTLTMNLDDDHGGSYELHYKESL